MKKTVLLLAMLLGTISAWAYTQVTIDNINYYLRDDNTAGVQMTPEASGDVVLPSTITYNGKTYTVDEIAQDAFKESSITSVDAAATITEVGADAFSSCYNLKSVKLHGVKTLGKSTFSNDYNLEEVVLEGELAAIPNFAFENAGNFTITMPATVKSIGECAFRHSGLKAVDIPGSVETIGASAFMWCTDLEDVKFHEGLKSIGDQAFQYSYVSELVFPEGLQTIGKNAFGDCTSIRKIVFPTTTITNMADGLFTGRWSLSTVECAATVPPTIPAGTFEGSNGTLYVPRASIEAYRAATGWSYFDQKTITALPVKGDLNDDDAVDIADVNLIINHILTGYTLNYAHRLRADLNGDNSIDITDVNILINMILEK